MKQFPFKILFISIFMPPICYILTLQMLEGYFQKRDAGKGGKGTPANLGMAIGIIKNTQKHDGLSKSKLNAFRRDLKELCDKYGIAY